MDFGFIKKWLRGGGGAPRKGAGETLERAGGSWASALWSSLLSALLRVRGAFLEFFLKSAILCLILLLLCLGSYNRRQYIGLILSLWGLVLSAKLVLLVYMVYTGSSNAEEEEEEE